MIAVSVSLEPSENTRITIRNASNELTAVLKTMDGVLLEQQSSSLYIQRNVHIYRGKQIYIAKRNQRRLWTRSAALRDADEIYAEVIRTWGDCSWE